MKSKHSKIKQKQNSENYGLRATCDPDYMTLSYLEFVPLPRNIYYANVTLLCLNCCYYLYLLTKNINTYLLMCLKSLGGSIV